MDDSSMSVNHALASHLLEGFEQHRRASTPPFGGYGLTATNTSTQLGFLPLSHGNFSQMSSMSSFSEDRLAEMQAKLNKKLGPEFISQRPGPGGGPKLTYAEGWKVINLANEVFGFNGWSSSVLSITTDYVDHNSETNRYNVGVSALVRVTLRDGAFHEDVGFGALENARGKGAALDKCKKEAVTDAIKRTLRNFGNVLGNCLYDKQYVSEIAKIKAPVVKLDQDTLHRRPDLAGPVPNMPPHESTSQPIASSSTRNPPAQSSTRSISRPTGNPSPLATSTPITNRTLGNELPTPDTSVTDISALNPQPATVISTARTTNAQPSRANNVASPITRPSPTSSNNRASPPAAAPSAPAPPANLQRTNSDPNLSDIELAGELPADGSVYGGSEDDAFFDNILPGELDLDVTEVPPAPRAETSPNSTSGRQDKSADQARSGDAGSSSSASAQPMRVAVSSRDNSGPTNDAPRPARLRLADAIRGGAPSGGAGSSRGDKRSSTSESEGQKRQRTS